MRIQIFEDEDDGDDEEPPVRPSKQRCSESPQPVQSAAVLREFEYVNVPQYLPSSVLPDASSFCLPSVLNADHNDQCAAVPEFGVHRGVTFTRTWCKFAILFHSHYSDEERKKGVKKLQGVYAAFEHQPVNVVVEGVDFAPPDADSHEDDYSVLCLSGQSASIQTALSAPGLLSSHPCIVMAFLNDADSTMEEYALVLFFV